MNWHYLESGTQSAPLNMAWDEALMLGMPRLGVPVLRFYGWTEPAASFGYFQRYTDVEQLTRLRPLVRRPTAGGIVPHDLDWTYSIAVPDCDPWYHLPAKDSYRRVHQWVRDAFKLLGFSLVLAPQALKSGPGQCFVGYEESDLLWNGRKIAGAAQRRTRAGLLIQGSVQPPLEVSSQRQAWHSAMLAAASQAQWSELVPDEHLRREVESLMQARYLRPEFHRKR